MFSQPPTAFMLPPIHRATTTHHALKVLVESHTIFPTPQQLTQRVRNVHLVGENDKTLRRTPPIRFILVFKSIPLKNPQFIARHHPFWCHLSTNRQKTIIIGIMRIGKCYVIFVEVINHNSFNDRFGFNRLKA